MKNLFLFFVVAFISGCASNGQKPRTDNPASSDYALADSIHFDHFIIDTLRKITGSKFERLVTSIGEEISRPAALEFEADNKTLKRLLGLKKDFKARGYLIFLSDEYFGNAPNKYAVLKSSDQFDILRCRLTRGANYDISTDSLIAKLREWHKQYPFEITGAHADWVSAEFAGAPADFRALAKEVYEFCPDVVDQGTGSIDALAQEMKEYNLLYLWWD